MDGYLFSKETKRLLKSGKPVILIVDGLEPGEMLKVYPDNTREIIRLDEVMEEYFESAEEDTSLDDLGRSSVDL